MNTYEGVCRYCGNIEPVMAGSQEEADNIISKTCTCSGAVLADRQEQLIQNLEMTIGPACEDAGFDAFEAELVSAISIIARFVLIDSLQSVTVTHGNTTLKITINTKGQVKVSRAEKKGIAAEC